MGVFNLRTAPQIIADMISKVTSETQITDVNDGSVVLTLMEASAIECANAFALKDLAEHPSVIILGVKNEVKLHQIRQFLIENDVQHAHFYEPDIGDELTAVATQPIFGERRRLFRKFQLVRPKHFEMMKGGAA